MCPWCTFLTEQVITEKVTFAAVHAVHGCPGWDQQDAHLPLVYVTGITQYIVLRDHNGTLERSL